ncbi:MAG: hypothetical protein KBS74_06505 [Clostridiales bacterium]|nr:hypothetical protein [Candidatus Cacconaster stercorequi]
MDMNFKTCMFGGFDKQDVIAFIQNMTNAHQEKLNELESENETLKNSNDSKESELLLLRQQAVEDQKEKEDCESLREQLETLQSRNEQLEQEVEKLRSQANDYQSLRDHIADIEISAHRRTEEFRAQAIAKLRETIDQQRAWCEKSKKEYINMNEQLVEKMNQAQEAMSHADFSAFEQMDQELQELSDSFDN